MVNNHFACIGSLDLRFGRWDTTIPWQMSIPWISHLPSSLGKTNNARILNFQDVENYINNAVSILETPRMPWHDVGFRVLPLWCMVLTHL